MRDSRISTDQSPVWVDEYTWACRKHVPAAYFPAKVEKCLYVRCGTCRPPEPDTKPQRRPRVKPPVPQRSDRTPQKKVVEPRRSARPDHTTLVHDAPVPAKRTVEKTDKTLWEDFDALPESRLYRQTIGDLRKYARHKLGIVGASKIPGGKSALVPLIMERRPA